MEAHDPEHETLLESIVVGDLPRESERARALLRACAACRERLVRLERLRARLAAAGLDERTGVAEAASGTLTGAQAERVRQFLEWRGGRARRGPRRGTWLALALAASLVAAIGVRLYWPAGPSGAGAGQGDVLLSGERDALRGVTPKDETSAFDPFTWIAPELKSGERFRLTITDASNAEAPPLVIATIERAEWRWADAGPTEAPRVAEFLAKAPRRIEWVVEIVNLGNAQVLSSEPVTAWLRD